MAADSPLKGAPATAEAGNGALGPIKASDGKRIDFLDHGLQISTKTGCLPFLGKPNTQTYSWDNIKSCKVETTCFSGKFILSEADGDSVASFKVPISKVRALATAIYSKISLCGHGAPDPEINKKLGQHAPLHVFSSGLLLSRKRGKCGKVSTFVPWQALVSLSLRPGCVGCMKSALEVKTLLEEPQSTKEVTGASAAAERPKGEEKGGEDAKQEVEEHTFVHERITGRAETMGEVFDAVLKIMNGGEPLAPLQDVPEFANTSLFSLGLVTTRRNTKLFLPWGSIAAVSETAGFVGKPKVLLTDCIGESLSLRCSGSDDLDALRMLIAKAQGQSGSCGDAARAIVQRNIRMSNSGLTIITKHLCSAESNYMPWPQVDGMEVKSTCCGGTLMLITETGQRLPICKAGPFGIKAMHEVAHRIQDMKYGSRISTTARTFAGQEGSERSCMLTDSSIRLVSATGLCSRVVRVIDLDSVNSCQTVGPRKLLVSVRETMKIDGDDKKEGEQPLEVRLRRTDDAHDISSDIMRRADARKKVQ